MASHSSAPTRVRAPHATKSTQTADETQTPQVTRTTRTATIINALTTRAQSVLNDRSIDAQSRAVIRYALETNDPWLAELVRRAEKREAIADTIEQLAGDSAQC